MKSVMMSAVLVVLGLFSQAQAAIFANPTHNGYALDWCRNFEQGCGKQAADLYCQKKGYGTAGSFAMRPQVSVPTMTIGQNAICSPSVHRCDSFQYISCQETKKTFFIPKYNGYRLDWCKQFEQGCGALAAQAYCQKQGFPKLASFVKQSQVKVPTMIIGSNAICNPAYHVCDSFLSISCTK